jgi:predicted transcriptional regulator
MEVHLSNDLETKLSHLAAQQGRDSSSLVVEAVERMVDYDEWFLAEVEKGLAQVEQGKTLSHEDMGARLEKYLASKQSHA